MNIIRYSQGKQPQIKISDLGKIFIPTYNILQKQIADLCKTIYERPSVKNEVSAKINTLIYQYYELTASEIENITGSITAF